MKTNINMNEKLKITIAVIAYIIIMLILSIAIVEADDKKPEANRFIGEISAGYSPLFNREHNIYAKLGTKLEIPVKFIYKNVFIPLEVDFVFAHKVKDCTRTDHTYITSFNTGFGYLRNFTIGAGYKFDEKWKVEYQHQTERDSKAWTGDSDWVILTYVLGQ